MIPFTAPTNYSEMLNKIAIFTFFVSLIMTVLVSSASPTVSDFLARFDIKVEVASITSIPIAYVVPPLIIALLARVIKLHDKISTLFRLRRSIDVYHILVPLAGEVGVPIGLGVLEKLKVNRYDWMEQVFYKYASSTDPKIDPHRITMALDKLTWFWILIELLVVSFLTLILLISLGAFVYVAWLAFVLLILLGFTFPMYAACTEAAKIEVKAILSDSTRKAEIKAAFNAL